MDEANCFVCGTKPADPTHPVMVVLKKTLGQSGATLVSKMAEVPVPACAECGRREAGAELRANGIRAAVALVPIVVGFILGLPDDQWRGALFGLGVGFFGSLLLRAFLGGRGRACEYPAVKEMEREGWYFEHLYSR